MQDRTNTDAYLNWSIGWGEKEILKQQKKKKKCVEQELIVGVEGIRKVILLTGSSH